MIDARFVNYCMKRIAMLVHNRVRPVVVFDGAYLPAKRATEAERLECVPASHECLVERNSVFLLSKECLMEFGGIFDWCCLPLMPESELQA